ncbi:MAG: flagellar brake protein [Treponema sp.]|nr:flagellar brake protein [Treponema sp.]
MGFPKGVYLYPLQFQMQDFYKQSDPQGVIFFFIGLGVLITVLVVVNIIRKKYNPPIMGGGGISGTTSTRHFSGFTLHRIANNIGLDREQTKMLEYVLKNDGVTDVERSINSPNLLDRHFKRTYRIIERSANTEEEAHERLSLLFSTRNILESASGGGDNITSTRQVPEKSAAVLSIGQESYPVKVISTKGDNLVVENPQNALGSPIRLPRGGKVILSFFTKSSKGFSFETRVLGTSDSADGPILQLVHSNQMKRLSQRRFRRKQAVIAANFYFVHVEDTGYRREKKMVVDKRRLTGNILDISIGGCSIKTNVPVNSGTRLKIEFIHTNGVTVAVLGQVLRTNRTGISTIMHIKFLKVPRRSLNIINTLVFDYADE